MQWISVNDRLQEDYEDVLCLFSDGTCDVDYMDNRKFWYENFPMQPTHWMPLPNPPKTN